MEHGQHAWGSMWGRGHMEEGLSPALGDLTQDGRQISKQAARVSLRGRGVKGRRGCHTEAKPKLRVAQGIGDGQP